MRLNHSFLFLALISFFFPRYGLSSTDTKVLKLYHDADWSNNPQSAESIWRGFSVAFNKVNHKIQGYSLLLVKMDHHGNVVRSKKNMQAFLEDNHALAIISGIHSPPLIKYREFINENDILTLIPWAAGGPITRFPSRKNWTFRLSVDDTKAGKVLVDFALNNKSCKSPHLLLENSSWGHSNLKNISYALKDRTASPAKTTGFDWGIKSHAAQSKIQDIILKGHDCIILVGNAIESALFIKAMSNVPEESRIPIISHWGITAGKFFQELHYETRKKVDLTFIQSCFSFMETPLINKGLEVFLEAKKMYPDEIHTPNDILSPAGFIHGYDLGSIFIAALDQIDLSNEIVKTRNDIRLALENLNGKVEGLIKTYDKPFSVFSTSNNNAHEALGVDDYCMARYGQQNEILIVNNENR